MAFLFHSIQSFFILPYILFKSRGDRQSKNPLVCNAAVLKKVNRAREWKYQGKIRNAKNVPKIQFVEWWLRWRSAMVICRLSSSSRPTDGRQETNTQSLSNYLFRIPLTFSYILGPNRRERRGLPHRNRHIVGAPNVMFYWHVCLAEFLCD